MIVRNVKKCINDVMNFNKNLVDQYKKIHCVNYAPLSTYTMVKGRAPIRVYTRYGYILVRIWSEWRLTVIAATVRIALVDVLDLSEVDISDGGFLYPAVQLC